MKELMRETFFGQLVNTLSGNRLFTQAEVSDPSLLDPYRLGKHVSSDASSGVANDSHDVSPVGEKQLGDGNDPEKGKDYQLVDWRENDPEMPRNWSTPKKFFVTFLICLLTFGIYIGSSIYTAGLIGITQEYGVSDTVAILGLTLFVIGYALGPMVFAGLSEAPNFGRTPVFIITLLIFVFFNVPIIYAKNIGTILAFRFLTGFIGSPVLAVGGAVIADLYRPSKQAYGIGIWGISAVCGPALGPTAAGYAVQFLGWRWSIYELIIISGAAFVVLFFFLPETSSANILFRRARRYRKLTGNQNLKCQPEIDAAGMSGKEIFQMVLVRPFSMTATEPILFLLNLYIALIYGLLYLWFESFPIVFVGIYGFSLGAEGLCFLGILVGALVTIPPFFWYLHHYLEPKFDENGEIAPEERLPAACVGAFFVPACLFMFGWTSRASVPFIVPIIGTALFPIGAFLLFNAVLGYLGDAYPKYVASVYASNDLVRSAFGAGFPLFANAMYTKLGVGGASSLLGGLSILFIPIPFVLYKYGKTIRMKSKMARHDL